MHRKSLSPKATTQSLRKSACAAQTKTEGYKLTDVITPRIWAKPSRKTQLYDVEQQTPDSGATLDLTKLELKASHTLELKASHTSSAVQIPQGSRRPPLSWTTVKKTRVESRGATALPPNLVNQC